MTFQAQTTAAAGAFAAFEGPVRLTSGDLAEAAVAARRAHREGARGPVLVFNRVTGEVVDLDLRGSEAEVLARYAAPPVAPKRGRPSLGVVSREITLLPRHWGWLARQPGGASTTLRRLVEAARKAEDAGGRERLEAAYRFMAAAAGDLPNFEEATRALFAGDRDRLDVLTLTWPPDVRSEVLWRLDTPFLQEKEP